MIGAPVRFSGSVEEAASRLGVAQNGATEWHGPCPACGGTDRYWIDAPESRRTGKIQSHCRQCTSSATLRAAIGGVLGPEPPDPNYSPGPAPPRHRQPEPPPSSSDQWKTESIRRGLARCSAVPPDIQRRWRQGLIVQATRKLSVDPHLLWMLADDIRDAYWPEPPAGAAGAIIAPMGPPDRWQRGKLPADAATKVHLLYVTSSGQPNGKPNKKSYGHAPDAVWMAHGTGQTLHTAEGIADILALTLSQAGQFVTPVRSDFRRIAERAAKRGEPLTIHADSDENKVGITRALEACHAYVEAGGQPKDVAQMRWDPDPGDAIGTEPIPLDFEPPGTQLIPESYAGVAQAVAETWELRRNLRGAEEYRSLRTGGDWQIFGKSARKMLWSIVSSRYEFERGKKRKPAEFSWLAWEAHLARIVHLAPQIDEFAEWLQALPEVDCDPDGPNAGRPERLLQEIFILEPRQPEAYIQYVSRTLVIATARRALHPPVEYPTTPVLIGPQGSGKSAFVRDLMPPEFRGKWWTGGIDLAGDEVERTRRCYDCVLVELEELDVKKWRRQGAKAWLSDQYIHIRPLYDDWATMPRRFITIATTDRTDGGSLPDDPAGNRRFLPVRIQGWRFNSYPEFRARMDELRAALWAEALHRARQREALAMPPGLLPGVNKMQRDEQREHPLIGPWIRDVETPRAQETPDTGHTLSAIHGRLCQYLDDAGIKRAPHERLTSATLRSAGWKNIRKRWTTGANPSRRWVPPPKPPK